MADEYWIWTEPLAFDNTQPDFGAAEYLRKIGRKVDVISLLMNHLDFIMLNPGMKEEVVLPPDVCSRNAHERNEDRERQAWTNRQIRDLISLLKKQGIKVFLSFFHMYFHNRFHKEWYDENRMVQFIGYLDDGRDFQDLFVEKLVQTMRDYGFSGWHSADAQGPASAINGVEAGMLQRVFVHFLEWAGIRPEEIPEEFRFVSDTEDELRVRRGEFVWTHFRPQLQAFMNHRWLSLHRKAAAALHKIGCEHAINSACAKSVFESAYYFGLDPRCLPEIGCDYYILESVATSCALIYGDTSFAWRIYASAMELKTVLPGVKMIAMEGVHDVVESYNSIQHAPSMLERDIYCTGNQMILTPEGEKRCTDGMMICLGDGLKEHEWSFLEQAFRLTREFPVSETEGYVWLCEPGMFDRLFEDHTKYGTKAPYLHVAELMARGIQLNCVCTGKTLDQAASRPLFVPDFDLLPEDLLRKVMERKTPTVLLGNLENAVLPDGVQIVLKCRIAEGYLLGVVCLHAEKISCSEIPSPEQTFDSGMQFSYVRDPAPAMAVPKEFYDRAGELLRKVVYHPLQGTGCVLLQRSADGTRRGAILSNLYSYFKPDFRFEKPGDRTFRVLSTYPCHSLAETEGKLGCSGSSGIYNNLKVPPMGIFLFEERNKK